MPGGAPKGIPGASPTPLGHSKIDPNEWGNSALHGPPREGRFGKALVRRKGAAGGPERDTKCSPGPPHVYSIHPSIYSLTDEDRFSHMCLDVGFPVLDVVEELRFGRMTPQMSQVLPLVAQMGELGKKVQMPLVITRK